ncbi:MAG: CpsD/CapB family tyrosine-protein kinase [Desulfosoma sp.]
MSTLKKALEKAKRERLHTPEPAPNPEPARSAGQFAYSRTPVVRVPMERLLASRLFAVSDDNPYADRFKLLRTRVLQTTRLRGWNTIQVSGFGANEGKSLLAANLAVALARDTRQTTLLVDLDFRRPSLHELFWLGDRIKGLDSFFKGESALEELFISPGIEKLTILPTVRPMARSAEIMGSPAMEAFIREIKQRYDDRTIIFDTPGMSVCPDPLIVSEYMDCVVLVARAGTTRKDAVAEALKVIPPDKLLGIVLNDTASGESGQYGYA